MGDLHHVVWSELNSGKVARALVGSGQILEVLDTLVRHPLMSDKFVNFAQFRVKSDV